MSAAEVERIIGTALRDMHDAVMRTERAQEALHRALLVQQITTADHDTLGRLFVQHVRCCWDEELRPLVVERIRVIREAELDRIGEAPF